MSKTVIVAAASMAAAVAVAPTYMSRVLGSLQTAAVSMPPRPSTTVTADEKRGTGAETGSACMEVGGDSPGKRVHSPFGRHGEHGHGLSIDEANMRPAWMAPRPSHEAAELLARHVVRMKRIMAKDRNTRSRDPVFIVGAEITGVYVDPRIKWINDMAVGITRIAGNPCVYGVIKLQANIVEGFSESERGEARLMHPVPSRVAEACAPHLSG
ncbi:MAG: hypothetical protein QI199_08130 [Candidatus Korarchaeota archaeon]|nr:hypothetical protein [Candidatus Korarchaeota archaeon]